MERMVTCVTLDAKLVKMSLNGENKYLNEWQ